MSRFFWQSRPALCTARKKPGGQCRQAHCGLARFDTKMTLHVLLALLAAHAAALAAADRDLRDSRLGVVIVVGRDGAAGLAAGEDFVLQAVLEISFFHGAALATLATLAAALLRDDLGILGDF